MQHESGGTGGAQAQQFVEPKSRAGKRTVPIVDALAVLLRDYAVLTDHRRGLLFKGKDGQRPVRPTALTDRMGRKFEEAELNELEARHTAASLFIAAGLNAKTVSTFMGHTDIGTTFDRYGHLFLGSEDQARGLLDAYLAGLD